jgi:hypothetical protein
VELPLLADPELPLDPLDPDEDDPEEMLLVFESAIVPFS